MDDSKKLNEKTRERLAEQIREKALAWAVAEATVAEIDTLNILQASLLAMKRAVEALTIMPDRIEVDGLHCPRVTMEAVWRSSTATPR